MSLKGIILNLQSAQFQYNFPFLLLRNTVTLSQEKKQQIFKSKGEIVSKKGKFPSTSIK
jgi:hypothetical protein